MVEAACVSGYRSDESDGNSIDVVKRVPKEKREKEEKKLGDGVLGTTAAADRPDEAGF